jgi:hypothetical protein
LIVGSSKSSEKCEQDGGRTVEMRTKSFEIGRCWLLMLEVVSKMMIARQLLDKIRRLLDRLKAVKKANKTVVEPWKCMRNRSTSANVGFCCQKRQ